MAKKKRRSRKKRNRKLMHESLEQRQLLAGDMTTSWQNAANPMDVNNDQVVSPLDALAFATEWDRTGPGPLDAPSADAGLPMMYVDVDGDGALTEQDFDALVAYLDNQMQPYDATGYVMGEGEGSGNEIPFADAGGPYSIRYGGTLYLDGHNSYDPDYGPNSLSYAWDLDEDGAPDLSGPTPDIEWSLLESTYGYTMDSTHTVSLTVSDGADSATASAEVTVAANEVPVADAGGPYTIGYGETLYLDGHNSYDPDYGPNSLSYEWDLNEDGTPDVSGPTPDIEWSILEATYGYNPNNTYTVSLTVTDGADSATETAQVTVINQGPIGVDDEYFTLDDVDLIVDASEGLLANDYDPDGGATLEAILETSPSYGSLTLCTDGSFQYNADDGYYGPDGFEYRAYDGESYSDPVFVSLHVAVVKLWNNDSSGSSSVTETDTTEKWIGEKTDLEVSLQGAAPGFAIGNVTWTVPGTAFKEYIHTDTLGQMIPLGESETDGPDDIKFYWLDPGLKTVEASVVVNSPKGFFLTDKSTKFDVKSPNVAPADGSWTPVSVTASVGNLGFSNAEVDGEDGRGQATEIGPPATFTRTGGPSEGEWAWAQLVDTFLLKTLGSGDAMVKHDYGLLDSLFPYDDINPVTDSPPWVLENAWLAAQRDDHFQMYLIWRKDSGSEWVAVRRVDWYFWFDATNNDPGNFDGWVTEGANGTGISSNTAVHDLPEWNGNVTDLVWELYG